MIRSAAVAVLVFCFAGLTVLSSGPVRLPGAVVASDPPTEADATFLVRSNGRTSDADFKNVKADFDDTETVDVGLGPVMNARSCATCHPDGRGASIIVRRCGKLGPSGEFIAPAGGTIVHHFSTDERCQQRTPEGFFTIGIVTPSLAGAGSAQAIRDNDILAGRDAQPADMRGVAMMVPITTGFDSSGKPITVLAVGRFFRKNQLKGLLDVCADALRNEIGKTSPLQKDKSTALDGTSLAQFDPTTGLNDPPTANSPFGDETKNLALFSESMPAPPRNLDLKNSADGKIGEQLFTQIGCAVCHTPQFVTAPVGSVPTGLQPVHAAIGNRIIHPYSDYLLHNLDIKVTENEVVAGPEGEALRRWRKTQPLWGLRTKSVYGHSAQWETIEVAIQGHGGQAAGVRANYNQLPPDQQRKIKESFLLSL